MVMRAAGEEAQRQQYDVAFSAINGEKVLYTHLYISYDLF